MPRCKICKEKFEAKYFLQKACSNPACLAEWSRMDREAKQKKKDKVRREALKKPTEWQSEAQSAFNKYIRIRDYKDGCISCSKTKDEVETAQGWKVGGCWDAGHFQTRGAKGQLRFVLFNVHKQCKSCNAGGGKFSSKAATVDSQYKASLIKKIGMKKVEWLENNNDIDLKKRDVNYLKRIKKIFNKKSRLYEKRFR